MTTQTLSLGVIGCGGIAQHAHLPSILRIPAYRLLAVSDPYESVAHGVARLSGLPESAGVTDHRKILEAKEVEAVCICAPTTMHAGLVVESFEAGKHVLVEKPMAVTTEEARRMIAAAAAASRTLMVGYNHTYDPAARELKRMLDQGELGEIRYAEAFFYEDLYAWTAGALASKVKDDNQKSFWPVYDTAFENLREFVHNFGSHVTNLFRSLLGEPSAIKYAAGDEKNALLAILDYGTFPLLFKNVRGRQAEFEKGIELCGTKKRVRLDLAPPLQRYTPGKLTITDMEAQSTTVRTLPWAWPFEEEHRHFVSCVLEGKPPLTCGEQAIGDVELAEDIARMATNGKVSI
jgi:predicted dehydrogenase